MRMLAKGHMVVSQNRGTPSQTPKYDSPDYGDPQKGTRILGIPPHIHDFGRLRELGLARIS